MLAGDAETRVDAIRHRGPAASVEAVAEAFGRKALARTWALALRAAVGLELWCRGDDLSRAIGHHGGTEVGPGKRPECYVDLRHLC